MKKWKIILFAAFCGFFLLGCQSQKMLNAVKTGDVVTVKKILDADEDFDVNQVYTKWRWTLLMYAVRDTQPEIVEMLLKRGADPTIKSRKGCTALGKASSRAYLGSEEYKQKQLCFMRRWLKRNERYITKWLQEYDKQHTPEIEKKKRKIKDLILKAYVDQTKPLANSIIHRIYKETNNPNILKSQIYKFIRLLNDPPIFDEQSKSIVKEMILKDKTSLFVIDYMGLGKDKDIIKLLHSHSDKLGDKIVGNRDIRCYLALCILAKNGETKALKKVIKMENNINNDDSRSMSFIPYGLSYIGSRQTVEILFNMLNSKLKHSNGGDALLQETQLAHEAAGALSLIVEGFPKCKPYKFSDKDKQACLEWLKHNKSNYKLKQNPVSIYFKTQLNLFYTE